MGMEGPKKEGKLGKWIRGALLGATVMGAAPAHGADSVPKTTTPGEVIKEQLNKAVGVKTPGDVIQEQLRSTLGEDERTPFQTIITPDPEQEIHMVTPIEVHARPLQAEPEVHMRTPEEVHAVTAQPELEVHVQKPKEVHAMPLNSDFKL